MCTVHFIPMKATAYASANQSDKWYFASAATSGTIINASTMRCRKKAMSAASADVSTTSSGRQLRR